MKQIITIAFLCLVGFSSCISQRYSHDANYPNPFEFQKVDTIDGTKDQLFVKANEWVAQSFNDAKSVIQMHDKEAGKIIAKGVMQSTSSMGAMIGSGTYYISYTLSITTKDGRYKIVLSDFRLTEEYITAASGPNSTLKFNVLLSGEDRPSTVYPKAWANLKGDCYRQSKMLIKSLKEAMNSKAQDF